MERFSVTGMSCAACSAHVEKAVSGVAGVSKVEVNLLTNSMNVDYAAPATAQSICQAVKNAGYGASPANAAPQLAPSADSLKDTETPVLLRRLIISVVLLLPLMYVSMGHHMWGWPVPSFLHHNPLTIGLYELLLSLAVMLVNRKFFVSGTLSMLHRAPNMDSLVALGSAASFVYSTVMLFAACTLAWNGQMEQAHAYMGEYYFESAAMILALITVGKTLEAYSKGKTTDAVRSLMDLAPKTATLRREGQEITVPVEEVRIGDIFVVRPGDSIPVDGEVLEGESAVNEAALTGESLPVDKAPGSTVSSATLNQSGYLVCRASRVGQDTTLSQIIRMVQDASATKAPIAKIADKVSGVFVPTVLALALLTGIVWAIAGQTVGFILSRAISVLVISCPCALGLATPVAIMVGNGKAARNGILFKTATSLEATGKVDTVVLDKTGTVTQGTPQVTDIFSATDDGALLALAAALEAKSEHPLAHAILTYAQEHALPIRECESFAALPGHGVKGLVDGKNALGGNAALMREKGLLNAEWEQKGEALSAQGKTPLYFAQDGELCGIIGVADVVKPDSAAAIAELKAMGVEVVLLTGDNRRTAQAIASQIGVDHVIADVLPDEKEAAVRRLLETRSVAMVGDGINDAPALTRATVGIAIGAGSDIALDAADVVLMKSSLLDVSAAIRLSRQALRNIHENLFWAFFYNCVGIPLAAGCWYPAFGLLLNPMFGAAAMGLSSFCVVSNALRLNLFNPRSTKPDAFYARRAAKKGLPALSDAAFITTETNRNGGTTMEKTLLVEGMMCKMCVAHVTKALEGVAGVESVCVTLDNGTAVVTGSALEEDALRAAVTEAGYTVKEVR